MVCWLIRPAHCDHGDGLTTALNGPRVMQGLLKGIEDDISMCGPRNPPEDTW
jgi:hypothetical protein